MTRLDRRALAWGAVAVIATLGVFLPTLRCGFVFDDSILIGANQNLTWARWRGLVTSPFWAVAEAGVPESYRQLGSLCRNIEKAASMLPDNPNVAWGIGECRRLRNAFDAAVPAQ